MTESAEMFEQFAYGWLLFVSALWGVEIVGYVTRREKRPWSSKTLKHSSSRRSVVGPSGMEPGRWEAAVGPEWSIKATDLTGRSSAAGSSVSPWGSPLPPRETNFWVGLDEPNTLPPPLTGSTKLEPRAFLFPAKAPAVTPGSDSGAWIAFRREFLRWFFIVYGSYLAAALAGWLPGRLQ